MPGRSLEGISKKLKLPPLKRAGEWFIRVRERGPDRASKAEERVPERLL
jgi:hypothetical protein